MKTATKTTSKILIGTVYVDSGQVIILDPAFARAENLPGHFPGYVNYDKVMELQYNTESLNLDCPKCIAAVQEAANAGEANPLSHAIHNKEQHAHDITSEDREQIGLGVPASTGVGDGDFPVYAIYEDGKYVGLEIRFQ